MLGDRACAAAALRQRRAGGRRAPPRSGTAARRPRRVGARPRYDLPSAPHRQPPDVPRRRRDVQRSDESVPPGVPQRLPSAAGGRALPLPGWDGALLRLASYRAPSDRFRTFQIASGVYLAFYVLGHMDSVFIFARTYLGIDTG